MLQIHFVLRAQAIPSSLYHDHAVSPSHPCHLGRVWAVRTARLLRLMCRAPGACAARRPDGSADSVRRRRRPRGARCGRSVPRCSRHGASPLHGRARRLGRTGARHRVQSVAINRRARSPPDRPASAVRAPQYACPPRRTAAPYNPLRRAAARAVGAGRGPGREGALQSGRPLRWIRAKGGAQ